MFKFDDGIYTNLIVMIFKDPIQLPCEDTICCQHLSESDIVKENRIKCKECNDEFRVRENQFKSKNELTQLIESILFKRGSNQSQTRNRNFKNKII
jgi:hypothetical protein